MRIPDVTETGENEKQEEKDEIEDKEYDGDDSQPVAVVWQLI